MIHFKGKYTVKMRFSLVSVSPLVFRDVYGNSLEIDTEGITYKVITKTKTFPINAPFNDLETLCASLKLGSGRLTDDILSFGLGISKTFVEFPVCNQVQIADSHLQDLIESRKQITAQIREIEKSSQYKQLKVAHRDLTRQIRSLTECEPQPLTES